MVALFGRDSSVPLSCGRRGIQQYFAQRRALGIRQCGAPRLAQRYSRRRRRAARRKAGRENVVEEAQEIAAPLLAAAMITLSWPLRIVHEVASRFHGDSAVGMAV